MTADRSRARQPLASLAAYAAAASLPVVSCVVTMHLSLLDRTPAALLFAAVALTAWFGYAVPTVVSILLSLMLYNVYLAPPIGHLAMQPDELVREAVLAMVAALIGLLMLRLRGAQAALSRDVSERHELELEHRRAYERARAAEAESKDMLAIYEEQSKALALAQQAGKCAAWIMDVEKREVCWLPGGFEIFGIPFSDDRVRNGPIGLVEAEDQPAVRAMLERTLATGAPFTPEFRLRWPNGEMRWQEARGILDPDNPKLIRGTTFDITDRKLTELSLLRVEKLAAVGRIASTIAHEINNPLASVTNLLYLALQEHTQADPLRGYLLTAQQELARLSNVTRLTLSYARPQSQARQVDPVEVVENVLSLFRARLEHKGIRIVRSFVVGVRVELFVDELQRVLTNLVANAIDAVDTGGTLGLTVDGDATRARIVVEDNGCGIPQERFERIFDPFFTTKDDVGTGIGLWVTRELVEKNGGTIAARSGALERGMRTGFELRFPRVAQGSGSESPAA